MQKIDLAGKTVLVTGAAGFIGNNLVLGQYRTKIVRQMRRQIFRQMKQKAQ